MDAEHKTILTQILGAQVLILSKVIQVEENQKKFLQDREPRLLNAEEIALREILEQSKRLFQDIQDDWDVLSGE